MGGGSVFYVIALCVSLTSLQDGVQSALLSGENEAALEQMLDHVMACREIPGLTMTVTRAKEYKTFSRGVSNLETKEPVTSKTLFHVGGITQTFTATLIAIVQQRSGNVVSYDVPIQALIGGDLDLVHKGLTAQVSLRDTMLHRTGLTTGSIAGLTGLPQAMSRSEVVKNLKQLPQASGLRETFNYNKFLFTLAAHTAERLMSSTWERLMRSHLLDRLLMSSTMVDTDDTSGPEFARSYVTEEGKMVEADRQLLDLGPLSPSGTMYTTSDDMSKALRLFLGEPQLFAQLQLNPGAMEELMSPHVLLGPAYRAALDRSSHHWPVPDFNVGAGMGFLRNVYRGFQVPWQPGHAHGFASIMWLIPERNVGIFIAINGQNESDMPLAVLQALAYYTTDLMLGFEPWINQTAACTFPSPWAEPLEFPDLEFSPKMADFALTDYQGIYSNPLLGRLSVSRSSTSTKGLAFNMAGLEGELLPEGGNVFRLFLSGRHKYMTSPKEGKSPVPFARLFFEFKGSECTGVKVPDTIFGGTPVDFTRVQTREEL